MTEPLVSGEKIELTITKSAFGGDGIAFSAGKICFVEGALPGETILAKITADKKNFSRAVIVTIIKPSPHRIETLCRYASHCGGCQYQHVSYAEELRMKDTQLADIFLSIPGITSGKIKPIVRSDREHGYRNSVTLHPIVAPDKGGPSGRKKSRGAALGFISKDNISTIPIKSCLIADPALSGLFGREYPVKRGTEKVTFKLSENGEIIPDAEEIFFRIKLGNESFLVSSKGFFQNNLYVARLLSEKISGWVREAAPDSFFDLYSGVGTFSVSSAKEVPKIICIEESGPSVQALRMNAEEKKILNLKIFEGRTEKIFPDVWEREKTGRPFILLDPPRQGIAPDFARFLSKNSGAAALAYISCDPVMLARDLKIILSSGLWDVRELAPFDMFPRTKHVETAALLTPLN